MIPINNNSIIKISIIIPVYNMEKHIECCLESILSQTVSEYEVICVNNGSSDGSVEIIRQYTDKFKNLKIIDLPHNKGAAYARNEGMKYARGEYILFLDSDDWIREDTVDILLRVTDKEKPDMVHFNYSDYFPQSPNHWKPISLKEYEGKTYCGQDLFTALIKDRNYSTALCFRLYKREFLISNNISFVNGINTEDTVFVFLCMMMAKTVIVIDERLYYYRRRTHSVSLSITKKRATSLFYSIILLLEYWKGHDFSKDVNTAINTFIQDRYDTFLWLKDRAGIGLSIRSAHDADKFMLRMYYECASESEEFLHLSVDDYDTIRSAKRCYIYGVGNYGKELFGKLQKAQIEIEAFLVTASKDKELYYYKNHPVLSLDEWYGDDDDMVLIAASDQYRKEMIEAIKSARCKSYYIVT